MGRKPMMTAQPRSARFGQSHTHGNENVAGIIKLDGVTIRRGNVDVLRNISFCIQPGSVTAIVGRSGVGKTSLISALNGLIRPVSGTISVSGIGMLDDGCTLREHRRRTATIFQDHALIDRLTAIDNVLLGLADTRHPLSPLPWPQAMRRRAAEALDDLGLLHRATARASQLSGGERQRVGVARALVRQPRLLLGDEPFSSVDPALVSQLSEKLRNAVAHTGLAIVIVLHQIETVRALANRIVGLADGGIAFDGTAKEFDSTAQSRIFNDATSAGRRSFLRCI
jgi:phosphonate transport system ATP-binding protein